MMRHDLTKKDSDSDSDSDYISDNWEQNLNIRRDPWIKKDGDSIRDSCNVFDNNCILKNPKPPEERSGPFYTFVPNWLQCDDVIKLNVQGETRVKLILTH